MSSEAADRLAARLAATPTPLDLVQEVARRRGEHPALVFMRTPDDPAPQVTSYAELADAAARACRVLADLGVGPDDGVALAVPAAPTAVAALLGAMSAGVAFPINLLLSGEAIASQTALAGVKAALCWEGTEAADRLRAAAGDIPVLDISGASADWPGRLAGAAPMGFAGAPGRAAALFHTGGTTGHPKLAELSARGVAAAALMGAAALNVQASDRLCVALPLFHVGGAISCVLSALTAGATVIFPGLLGGRDPELRTGVWRLLERRGATILGMVPTSLAGIVDTPVAGADLSALRAVVTGAAPLPEDLSRRLEAKLGVPVCQMYGMTELSGVCSAQPCDGRFRAPSVGRPAPLIEVQIAEGAPGELSLRGPNSFLGYRTPAGRTGAPAGGWVATGDLGVLGPDGELRLLGRSKDVIIRGGHNIDPLLIEEVAQQHPAVRIAAAAPMPDAYAGQLPVLYVALTAGADPEEIAAFVAARIPDPPARPKRVFVLPELPMTAVGKIARFRLRQAAALTALKDAAGADMPADLSCDDPAGRQVGVAWTRPPTADEAARLRTSAESLGLELAAAERRAE
jgi:fatty-acyl-CoA synthase